MISMSDAAFGGANSEKCSAPKAAKANNSITVKATESKTGSVKVEMTFPDKAAFEAFKAAQPSAPAAGGMHAMDGGGDDFCIRCSGQPPETVHLGNMAFAIGAGFLKCPFSFQVTNGKC
jgi:hypothetical protein